MKFLMCKDCVYYVPYEERDRDRGFCHRYPNKVKKDGISFCGEFKSETKE